MLHYMLQHNYRDPFTQVQRVTIQRLPNSGNADSEVLNVQYEQKQNRSWLGHQMTLPDSNGISRWQHAELFKYFSAPTLAEKLRPPLLKEGLKLSIASKEHIARLDGERAAAKQAQGLMATSATKVANWWDEGPRAAVAAPVSDFRASLLIVVDYTTSLNTCLRTGISKWRSARTRERNYGLRKW